MKRIYRLFHLSLIAAVLFIPALTVVAETRAPDSEVSQGVVPGGPNPVLTKSMSPQRPVVGQVAWITIVATNTGSANAENVVITDPLPDNIALLAVRSTQGAVQVSHHIVTVYVGTLAPGQTVTVTNDVVITREFANDTPYTNCTGLTYRDGTARLACFPFGPAFDPVSVTTPPRFLPEAGAGGSLLSRGLLVAGAACLLAAKRLRRVSTR